MLLEGLHVTELPPWLVRTLATADLKAFVDRLRIAIAAQDLPNT
jgi:hypothetical protein